MASTYLLQLYKKKESIEKHAFSYGARQLINQLWSDWWIGRKKKIAGLVPLLTSYVEIGTITNDNKLMSLI